jgi:two-component system CheB/CheR fusion protein
MVPKDPAFDSPLRIVVVENHPDTMDAIGKYLVQLGHTVISASCVKEALEALPSSQCDVLISDIGLPDGDGWDLLRKANLPDSVYSIAMSGFGMTADRAKSKAAGYRRHLLKPFDPEELDKLLEEAARERAANSSGMQVQQ